MTSPPLDSTYGQTTSGVALPHYPWAAHTVGLRRAWHAIITLGSTHGRMTWGVACYHRVWEAHMVERRQALHSIIAFGQHTQSNDVERGMTSPPLDNTHSGTTSSVTCYHCLWTAHTVKLCWAWHAIIALRQYKWSNHVRRGGTSPPLDSKHGLTTLGVA